MDTRRASPAALSAAGALGYVVVWRRCKLDIWTWVSLDEDCLLIITASTTSSCLMPLLLYSSTHGASFPRQPTAPHGFFDSTHWGTEVPNGVQGRGPGRGSGNVRPTSGVWGQSPPEPKIAFVMKRMLINSFAAAGDYSRQRALSAVVDRSRHNCITEIYDIFHSNGLWETTQYALWCTFKKIIRQQKS